MVAFRCKCSCDQYMGKGIKIIFVDEPSKHAGLHFGCWQETF